MTTVRMFNDISGRDSTINLSLSVSAIASRLRDAIGEGDYDDIHRSVVSIYARVVGNQIAIFFYGCGIEESNAEMNRIKVALTSNQKGKVTS